MAGVLAFVIAGYLATAFSWRYSFGALFFVSIAVFFLSFRLKPVPPQKVTIDTVGAILAAAAVILISLGFNNLNSWGLLFAKEAAPFTLLGLSPAPFMIIVGVVLGQSFFSWLHRRQKASKTPLLSLEVVDSPQEKNAIFAMFIIGALGPAVNFLIPLYIQIVQGRTSMQTAVAVVPYTLAIFTSAVLIVRLYSWLSPRQIGSVAFVVVATGLTLLGFTIQNEWGTPVVILGLVILGLGEGSLLTLLFNVLVSSSPKELAGDVGALRGTANNLSTALGTAFAGVVAVGLLSILINTSLVDNPAIPPELKAEIPLSAINYVSNDQLLTVLSQTSATPEQVAEAVRINEEARLRSLRSSFLILAGISLLAIVPALGLPNYTPQNVPVGGTPPQAKSGKKQKRAASVT
jgi:MFS family permease